MMRKTYIPEETYQLMAGLGENSRLRAAQKLPKKRMRVELEKILNNKIAAGMFYGAEQIALMLNRNLTIKELTSLLKVCKENENFHDADAISEAIMKKLE